MDAGDGEDNEYYEAIEDQNNEDSDVNSNEDGSEDFNVFLKAVAITYNDWMNLKNIPYSTCTLIIKEIFESYSERKLRTERNLRNILDNEGMESLKIKLEVNQNQKEKDSNM